MHDHLSVDMLLDCATDLSLFTNGPVYKDTHMVENVVNSLFHPVNVVDSGDVVLPLFGLVCQLLPDIISVVHIEKNSHKFFT